MNMLIFRLFAPWRRGMGFVHEPIGKVHSMLSKILLAQLLSVSRGSLTKFV